MSTSITFPLPDGATFIIPQPDDQDWGQNVTNFLLAIPNGVPPRNGTFALTGDLSFGPTFGLKSQYYKSLATNIASTGVVRLAVSDAIKWRNNANSGDLALAVNGTDNLTFNGVQLATSGSGVSSIAGTAHQIIASASTGAVTLSTPQNIDTNSTPTFAALALTSGSVPHLNIIGTGATAAQLLLEANSLSNIFSTDSTGNFSLSDIDNTRTLIAYNRSSNTIKLNNLVPTIGTPAGTGTITPDASSASQFNITVSGTLTVNGPTNGSDGQKITFRILNDASHSVTLATGSGNFSFGTDITSYTNSVSLTDYIGAIWNAPTSRWNVVAVTQGF